jgi:hypothetical protein
MNEMTNFFKNNNYIYVKDFISKEICDELTQYMFYLKKQNKLNKDDQCPISDSVYGDVVFDRLLQELVTPLANVIGIRLIPTYTYARIYRPGEELKPHVDRNSCEISVTMTLGYDKSFDLWPIYFSNNIEDNNTPVIANINIGDIVIYKGNMMTHWREKYSGNWQSQAFFHYVEADGPYQNKVYDNRPHKTILDSRELLTQ